MSGTRLRAETRGSIALVNCARISDPTYDPNTSHAGTLEVKTGEYNCYVTINDFGEYGERIMGITVIHNEYDNPDFKESWIASKVTAGVDSAQCGIFDSEYFERHQEDDEWQMIVYNKTHTENGFDAGIVDGQCLVSSSGFGDGAYNCFVKYNEDGAIVAINVQFISMDE